MRLVKFVDRFRIDKPNKFRLSKCDAADACGLDVDRRRPRSCWRKALTCCWNCKSVLTPRIAGRCW